MMTAVILNYGWTSYSLKKKFLPVQDRIFNIGKSPKAIMFTERKKRKDIRTMVIGFHTRSEADLIFSRRHTLKG